MKILVTGGLGFIGSNFILQTLKKYPDFRIINVDAGFWGSNQANLSSLIRNKNYSHVKGNITNRKLMEKLISKTDVAFNFAAESHVDRSIYDPKPFIDSNIFGVYTILEAIKKYKKKFIQISTDEVFGSLKSGRAHEKYPFNTSSPYAASKASAELLVQSYTTTYDCDTIITRSTNNYGPHQFPEKFIPKTIILAEKDKKIPVYGTGKNIRDWIFVLDHCDAILRVFFKGKPGQSYNIAASNQLDNITLVKKILEIMGKSSDLIELVTDRPGHDFRYSLNSSKIRNELGWKPSYNFEKGLKYTINWYLQNKTWWKNISPKILSSTPWKTR